MKFEFIINSYHIKKKKILVCKSENCSPIAPYIKPYIYYNENNIINFISIVFVFLVSTVYTIHIGFCGN